MGPEAGSGQTVRWLAALPGTVPRGIVPLPLVWRLGVANQRALTAAALVAALLAGSASAARAELTPEQTSQAEALVQQFSAREFAARQKAVEELLHMGRDVLPLVRKTLAETKDAEVKLRCEMVVKGLADHLAKLKLVERRITDLGPGKRGRYPKLSPDGTRLAFILTRDAKQILVCNGKEGRPYDEVSHEYVLSPDGKHLAYDAKRGEDELIVHDGKEEGPYEHAGQCVFSPDSRRFAYVFRSRTPLDGRYKCAVMLDGKPSPAYFSAGQPAFSPDSKHFAYRAKRRGKDFVVLDGKEEPHYGETGTKLYFSPDSSRLAYWASHQRKGSTFMVCDGKEGPGFDRFLQPVFSPDSKHLAYQGRRGDRNHMVLDGELGPAYDGIYRLPLFSRDSKRLAYLARRDDKEYFIVCDGKEGPAYQEVGRPVFSADSRHLAYVGSRGDRYFIVRDGKEQPTRWRVAAGPWFSPDSRRLVYVASKWARGKIPHEIGRFVVCDGKTGPMLPFVGFRGFSPDSRHIVTIARRERRWFLRIDGIEGPPHDWIMIPRHHSRTPGKFRYVVGDGNEAHLVETDWPKDLYWTNGLRSPKPE